MEAPCSQLCPDTWTHTHTALVRVQHLCSLTSAHTSYTCTHFHITHSVCFTVCSTNTLESLLLCT